MKVNIGLLWHSLSSDNLGVGALTESQIAIVLAACKRAGVTQPSFTVFGTSGTRAIAPVSVPVEKGDRFSWKRLAVGQTRYWAQLRACDLVLDIGEGDSFTDIYGLERFWLQAGTKAMALISGKTLVLSPQTIGPFERSWTRAIARGLMRRAKRVYARDQLSTAFLADMQVSGNTAEAIDVAFRLPFTRHDFGASAKQRVGINVSGLLYNGGYSRDNQFGLTVDYRRLTEELVAHFVQRGGGQECEVHLVGHVLSDVIGVEDDHAASLALAELFPGVVVAPKFATPSEAKSYIAGLDYFTGARMHACIAAFSSGVPVTPLGYSRKFTGLFNTLGYQQVADCKKLSTEAVRDLVIQGYEQREVLRPQVQRGCEAAAVRLQAYEDFLVDCLQQQQKQKKQQVGHR